MVVKELDLTGKTLSNYKVIGRLGRGGMATVYKAHELSLNRMVALKVLSSHLSEDTEYIKRFHREAQAAAQLNHPNIVQIYSIGEEKGLHYFAMEYIKGNTLSGLKQEVGVLMPEKAVTIIKEVADALGEAHKHGLVHRDIKPSNIMMDSSGRAKVTDFGIAYVSSANTKLTREGSIIGTPEYLSPEQCEGKTVDRRSDIYSLGVTLYEILTGKTPYEADTPVSMLMKIVKGSFPPIKEVNANLPTPLCNVVEKMMETDVDKRYASMEEVSADLVALGIGQPLTGSAAEAVPVPVTTDLSQSQPAAVESKGNKRAALIVAAVIVLLMGGAFAAKLLIFDKQGQQDPNPIADQQDKQDQEEQQDQFVSKTQTTNQELPKPGTDDTESPVTRQPGETGYPENPAAVTTSPGEGGDSSGGRHNTGGTNLAASTSGTTVPPSAANTPGTTSTGNETTPQIITAPVHNMPSQRVNSGGSNASPNNPPPAAATGTIKTPPPPPSNSCVISAVGDSEKSEIVAVYLEEILARKKYIVLDGPSVSGQDVSRVARNRVVITARQLGSTELNAYGRTYDQYSVSLSLKVISTKGNKILGGPVTKTVSYTALNADDNLKEAVAKMVARLNL
ncbi:MAG: protein kinase [bacterium]|nr:protein kinase [bacterium]